MIIEFKNILSKWNFRFLISKNILKNCLSRTIKHRRRSALRCFGAHSSPSRVNTQIHFWDSLDNFHSMQKKNVKRSEPRVVKMKISQLFSFYFASRLTITIPSHKSLSQAHNGTDASLDVVAGICCVSSSRRREKQNCENFHLPLWASGAELLLIEETFDIKPDYTECRCLWTCLERTARVWANNAGINIM